MPDREDRPAPPEAEFPSSRLVPILGPFIGVAAFTAGVAIVAAILDWYRYEMLLAAAAVSCAAALPTLYLIYRQLAERKVAQAALRNAQARVGGLVEAAMDAIISVDEQQRVVLFNRAAERVFRWPRAAVLGQRLDMLIPERFRPAHRGHIERFGRSGSTSRGMGNQILYGLRSDGEEFPIEASISQHEEAGRKLYTVILRDVTERLRGERLLARSEARLRGILDSAMDAIITVDARQHIVLFNRAAEEVFGCPRDQAIGAPLAWFIPERFRHAHAGMMQRFGQTGDSSRRMGGGQRIVMGLRRNGEEFPIDASISHIVEEGEHFYTVILRDVTERVKADEALRESREEIRHLALTASSVREQEKSRIARELHDELGQALTALKIDVGWLREHLGGGVARPVQDKLGSMQVLLDGTVAAARRISADLRPLMLDDLGLVAACEWLAHNFQQRTGTPCELVLGAGDLDLPDPYATAVFRVMQESLTNIAKHAGATQVEATLERADSAVTLTVRDNGRGFTPSGPRKEGSYGLVGLRERAFLLGGEIRIESAPGQGTVVEMRIPMSERAEETEHT